MTAATVRTSPITPPSVSLINAAIVVDELEERWVGGILYRPEGCGTVDFRDVCDSGEGATQKSLHAGNSPALTGTSHLVVASDTCSTFGFQQADYRARATRMLLAVESYQLALELWEGVSGDNVYLAQPGLAQTVGTAIKPLKVIGELETAFYDTAPAQRAMIHMSPKFLERLMAESGGMALRREGNVYYTWMDSVVAVDKGYRGKGPGNGSREWLYITPVAEIRRGAVVVVPDTMSEAVIRRSNDVAFFAERPVSATFNYNCQVYTASVDLT